MLNLSTNIESQSSISLTNIVIDYIATVKRLCEQANHQPDFSVADWAPLAELTALDDFEWANHNNEVLNWNEYIQFLTQWARSIIWGSTIQRIHQWQNAVFVEHEEHHTFDDRVDASRSITVFEFNKAGKVRHLAVYLQKEPSLGL